MRLWPYPAKIININPDDFQTPLVPTHYSYAVTPPKVYEKDPNQPILFMLYTELGHLPTVIFKKVIESLNTAIATTGLTPVIFENKEGKILLGFDSYTYLLECLPSIFKTGRTAQQADKIRVSLHCGSVVLTLSEGIKMATGDEVKFLKKIYSLTPEGACCSSDYFSSIIALEIKKFELRYMGMVPDEKNMTRTLYRVNDLVRKFF
jgi:hypothetical protein